MEGRTSILQGRQLHARRQVPWIRLLTPRHVARGPYGPVRVCLALLALPLFIFMPTPPPAAGSADTIALDTIPLTGCTKVAPSARTCEEPVRMEPEPISWEAAWNRMGPQARIPRPDAGQRTYQNGSILSRRQVQTVDLSERVPQWLAMRFDGPGFDTPEPWMKSVGDMLETFHKTRGEAARQEELLGRLASRAPRVWEQVRDFLPEWARDDYLYSDGWTPQRTGRPARAENDGILERPPFLLAASPSAPDETAQDEEEDAHRKIYQASAPVYASLEELFAAENDFGTYHRQAGANYREVFPLEGAYFTGTDPAGSPFLLYDVSYFQRPLPLWNLRFKLRQMLHRPGGRWQMENRLIEGDMHYLRLSIFYDPIHTLDGRLIGHVKTEWLDVDIRGLPDRDADRQAGVRGDVGNIKRMAEERSGGIPSHPRDFSPRSK